MTRHVSFGTPAMTDFLTNEFLGFNLKLLGKKTKKNVLVSAGKMSDKEKMFPALQKLSKLNVDLFATPGTFRFLKQKGIENQEIHKIENRREPNIRTFLADNRLAGSTAELRKILQENPSWEHADQAHMALGANLEKSGDPSAAIQEYQRALALNPSQQLAAQRLAALRPR